MITGSDRMLDISFMLKSTWIGPLYSKNSIATVIIFLTPLAFPSPSAEKEHEAKITWLTGLYTKDTVTGTELLK